MTRRRRFTYEPVKDGWVTISNKLSNPIWRSERCQGNAQEVFTAKLEELKRNGWTVEGTGDYDSVFAHRGNERVNVAIHRRDPDAPIEQRLPLEERPSLNSTADVKATPPDNVRRLDAKWRRQ